jgi:hypothetical protein
VAAKSKTVGKMIRIALRSSGQGEDEAPVVAKGDVYMIFDAGFESTHSSIMSSFAVHHPENKRPKEIPQSLRRLHLLNDEECLQSRHCQTRGFMTLGQLETVLVVSSPDGLAHLGKRPNLKYPGSTTGQGFSISDLALSVCVDCVAPVSHEGTGLSGHMLHPLQDTWRTSAVGSGSGSNISQHDVIGQVAAYCMHAKVEAKKTLLNINNIPKPMDSGGAGVPMT